MKNLTLISVLISGVATLAVGAAHAGGINSTLGATYYQVLDSAGDPDFNSGTFPVVAAGSSLGPDGLPVATGVNDLNSASEITWWSPAFNTHVTQTGTGSITLPFSGNQYPPNATGTNDETAFETAKYAGTFSLGGPGTVTFTLGSDDDTFLYVDGTLVTQNPGVHGVTTATSTSGLLTAGTHQLTLFYADRENTGAFLSIDSSATITPTVPEPASWALMLVGFGGLGGLLRRRAVRVAA